MFALWLSAAAVLTVEDGRRIEFRDAGNYITSAVTWHPGPSGLIIMPSCHGSVFAFYRSLKYGILYMKPFIIIFGQFLFLFPAFDISKYVHKIDWIRIYRVVPVKTNWGFIIESALVWVKDLMSNLKDNIIFTIYACTIIQMIMNTYFCPSLFY